MTKEILRRFIREALCELEEDTVPPNKWSGDARGPASPEDMMRLGGDTGVTYLEEEELDEEEDEPRR
jgi:hypothetical protein